MHFQTFFSDFSSEITEKGLKWAKKVENRWKKCFHQLLGGSGIQKLVKIHNIQQSAWSKIFNICWSLFFLPSFPAAQSMKQVLNLSCFFGFFFFLSFFFPYLHCLCTPVSICQRKFESSKKLFSNVVNNFLLYCRDGIHQGYSVLYFWLHFCNESEPRGFS